jgi:hypothetical protein
MILLVTLSCWVYTIDPVYKRRADRDWPARGRVLREPEVRPVLMVVAHVIGHKPLEMPFIQNNDMVQQISFASLGWYGLDGDRRLAFRRTDNHSGMPWLTAGKLPELVLFAPQRREGGGQGDLPTHIRTPDGAELAVFGEALAAEVGRRYGAPVEMMHLRHGIFDEACVSVIASDTVSEIGRLAREEPGYPTISPECRGSAAAARFLFRRRMGGRRALLRRRG